ncbi:M23 family metallopeptidase [Pontibacter ramchanderi]|uniref:M23 family metallopeptidase n=1 Tax=Pontibacter ramchanderi TaxID=1179743 RepID=UPI0015D56FE1|nr:M23 family metallopeptidase [Pontibacter ramchanderi]
MDKSKASNFRYTYTTNYGDHNLKKYTEDFNYFLPYKKGTSHKVWQGYNGNFSHQGENSLDFIMTEGTDIHAVRDGVVVKVVQENNISCVSRDCAKFNNYILIYHSDGTFAEYAHIKHMGALVKEGEKVAAGQSIGYSGNVGYSSGPHLHLAIFMQKLDERVTLTTRFLTGDGSHAEALQEQTEYIRSY